MENNLNSILKEAQKSPSPKDRTSMTISYSKGGTPQSATFYRIKGVLQGEELYVGYGDEAIAVPMDSTDDQILELVKLYAYAGRAEITHRNHQNITYPYLFEKAYMGRLIEENEEKLIADLYKVYEKYLVPILNRNKWFFANSHMGFLAIGYYNEEDELDNIPRNHDDGKLMENILNYFFNGLRLSGDKDNPWYIAQRYVDAEDLNEFLTTKIKKEDK